jgi:hypothetical protein
MMKYKRLTKEQFEELHLEFANFLATQSIDKKEWDTLKVQKPAIAEQELDVFSDLIWEGVLTNAKYLEHFSPQHLFLFHCQTDCMQSIIIKSNTNDVDFMTKNGLVWLSEHIFTHDVEVHTGRKTYSGERNAELFALIHQGAILSDGQLYEQINEIINQAS